MEKTTYNKLLVIYKDFTKFFEKDAMMLFRAPDCLDGLQKLLAKENARKKK